jgi:hypothetical protein
MHNSPTRRETEGTRTAVSVVIGAVVLVSWPVAVAFARRDGAPVGADTPVYVWWARLVGFVGSSAVAMRPGVPNVTAVVGASLGISETAVVAGLGCVLVAMLGLAGCAVLRAAGKDGRIPMLGLALTGIFGTYLASGHLSNAVFAASFVLALAFVLDGRPGTIACAALLVGAAGLAHPDFLVVAMPVLIGFGALSLVARDRRDTRNIAVTAVAGLGVSTLGLVAAASGGTSFDVPTSLDVFLAQTHQVSRLHALFLERFRPKLAGYALWAWLPLAAVAIPRLRTRLGRLLMSWVAVTVIAVIAGLALQPFPPHRIVAFAFCLPLLATLALDAIGARLPRFGLPVAVGVVLCIAASATRTWMDAPRPFNDPSAAGAAAAASQIERAPSGVVVVDLPPDANATAVAVIRWTNLLRATVPASRIEDVVIRFPEPDVTNADSFSLWRSSDDRVRAALAAGPVSEVALGDPTGIVPLAGAVSIPSRTPAPPAPTTSVAALIAAIAGWVTLCGIAGCGWCIAAGQRGVRLLERSVGVGLGVLIFGSSLVDRMGLRLGQRSTALGLVVGVATAGAVAALAATRGRPFSTNPPTRRAATTPHRRVSHPSAPVGEP